MTSLPGVLADQTILVLGGTSGLGLATAQTAHAQGATVVITGRDASKAEQACSTIGERATWAAFDAADADAFAAFAQHAAPFDHVVSFTGAQPVAPVGQAGRDMFHQSFDARVWAARNACAIIGPRMPATGSFVFCSGLSAIRPRAGRSAGAVATAALESFCRAMAVELAPQRVNAICPGPFDTQVLRRAFGADSDAQIERIGRDVPLGRIGRPDEIGHAIVFLLTNTFTTGITLRVDGGALLV